MRKYKRRNIIPIEIRFFNRVIKSDNCWNWIGTKTKDGYGILQKGRSGEGSIRSHIFSYSFHVGKISVGLCVCHKCDNRLCVNPDHLFLGSRHENICDMWRKGRGAKGEKSGASKLSEKQVKEIRKLSHMGMTHKEISTFFDVSRINILHIVNRNTWKHI